MTTLPANQPISSSKAERSVKSISGRMKRNLAFQITCLAATLLAILILIVLLLSIITQGIGVIDLRFITSLNSSDPHKAGIWTSLIGTIMIVSVCALSAIPLGVGTAVLIEEFKPKNKTLLWFHGIIDTNIRNLAGVPSIVYGILGVSVFATMFGVFGPMGSGNFAIGITWFDQYQGEDKHVYYAPRSGSLDKDPEVRPASSNITLYQSTDLKQEATGLDWVTEETIKPRIDAIEEDMDDFEDAFRDELGELRTSRRGPIAVNETQAEKAVVASILAGNWKIDSLDQFEKAFREQMKTLKAEIGSAQGSGASDTSGARGDDSNAIEAASEGLDAAADELAGAAEEPEPAAEPKIGQDMAREMAQKAITAGNWTNTDTQELEDNLTKLLLNLSAKPGFETEAAVKRAKAYAVLSEKQELREKLIELVLALDGQSGVKLIMARKNAISEAVVSEYATRLPGVMMIGKEPVRINRKAWYHFSLPFGRGVLAGGLTLMLVILPIVIVASQEALRAVPSSYRQGALAMGATRWQAVSKTALPAAIPGICTGTILAISRAIGEAAPILVLGGTGFITSPPQNLMDKFSAMPMTIFQWTKEPEAYFKEIAAGGIIILLVVLLSFNAIAIYIRHRAGRHH